MNTRKIRFSNHSRAGNDDYQWHNFAGMRKEEWSYFSFDPTAKQPTATSLQLADKGETGNPLVIWSGDRLMDLDRYQMLRMVTKTIADKEYLFIETKT